MSREEHLPPENRKNVMPGTGNSGGDRRSPEILMPGNDGNSDGEEEDDDDGVGVGMNVLAIDSSPIFLAYLLHLLNLCRYEVKATTKVDEALALLRDEKDKFDLVITDVVSHEVTEYKLLEIISFEMDIPVIVLTLKDDYESAMKGIRHGARDWISKPPRLEEIKKLRVYKKKLEHPRNQQKNSSDSTKEQFVEPKELSSLNRTRNGTDSHENPSFQKRERISWEPELHQKFVDAVLQLGIDNAVPIKILNLMNVPGLTREKIGSHLQKFRQTLKRGSANRNGTSSSNTSMDTRPNSQTGLQLYPHGSSHAVNQTPHHVQNQRQQAPPSIPQFQHLFWQNPNLGVLQQQQQEHMPLVVSQSTMLGNHISGSTSPLHLATCTSPISRFTSLFGTSLDQRANLPQEPFVSTTLDLRLSAGATEVVGTENFVHDGNEHSNRNHGVLDSANNVFVPRGDVNTNLENHLERVGSAGDEEITTLVRQFHDEDKSPPLL